MNDKQILQKLEDAQGAILGWQLPRSEAPAFADALRRRVILLDGDLYVHPDAVKHSTDAPEDAVWWEMPDVETHRMLEKVGFTVYETGGGCTAWRRDMGVDGYCLITKGDDPSHVLIKGEEIAVGFYEHENEHGSAWILIKGVIDKGDI